MRALTLGFTMVALAWATTAQAAQDTGLNIQNYRSATPRTGVGAQLGLTLKLDGKHTVRDAERLQIGFAAGPVMAVPDVKTGSFRRGISNFAGFSLRPGYSATLMFAGQPVATSYTVLGAAESAKDEANKPEKNNRGGPSTVAYVAIGAGVLLVIGVVASVRSVENITSLN